MKQSKVASSAVARAVSLITATLMMVMGLSVANAQAPQGSGTVPNNNPLQGDGVRLQVGPTGFKRVSSEFPTIDYFLSGDGYWYVEKPRGEEYPASMMDAETGFPKQLINGKRAVSDWTFDAFDKSRLSGTWVVELEGEGRIAVSKSLMKDFYRESDKKIEFKRDSDGRFASSGFLILERIDGPITGIRLYRKEDENRLNAGHTYRKEFIDEIAKYHVVRTMTMQGSNSTWITRADQVPPVDYNYWAARSDTKGLYQAAPLEALFELAIEADVELWMQAPLQLGFPYEWTSDEIQEDHHRASAIAKEKAHEILASEEWDRYAARFVDTLIASGYDKDRPLYLSLGNEVWNFAGGFAANTRYAMFFGQALTGSEVDSPHRKAYGAMLGRLMVAVEDALAERNYDQNIIYVLESMTPIPRMTRLSFETLKAHLEGVGREDLLSRTGVGLTTYWGFKSFEKIAPKEEWQRRIAAGEGDALAVELADWLISPDNTNSTSVAGMVNKWLKHEEIAQRYGSFILGAYEGGSHANRPGWLDKNWYTKFQWGEQGARVNAAVNAAIVEAFPDVILSNYVIAGEQKKPWSEGLLGADNPYARSWAPYLKSPSAAGVNENR